MESKLEILSGGEEMLGQIEEMWVRLTLHAAGKSKHFSPYFAQRTFEQRRKELSEKAATMSLRVDIALDPNSSRELGYCVSTVGKDGKGEIESLYVDDLSRGRGVGDRLLTEAISWMERKGAESICVFTVHGSEEVLPFYAHHGFLPKMLMLERKKEQQD
jgi:GNAT superfamily N-acetyltransferase